MLLNSLKHHSLSFLPTPKIIAQCLSGNKISKSLREQITLHAAALQATLGRPPALATLLIGQDPASIAYVKRIGSQCTQTGFNHHLQQFKDTTSTEEIISTITQLNQKETIDGILLQHPMPKHIEERACFNAISPEKDIDGVNIASFGRLSMGEPAFAAATATGIMTLLRAYKLPIQGQHVVIVGRSPILGKPLHALFLNANATPTLCHSKTENLPELIKHADIIIGALGKPEFIKGSWIKKGAVLVDAGFHFQSGSNTPVGDIELTTAISHCSAYTPIPGGVGPMTLISLLQNTLSAAEKKVSAALQHPMQKP